MAWSAGDVESTGWLLDVLLCVERINKSAFSLEDVYAFEGALKAKHPANHNVRAKVRQQLQILRDKGVIEFVGRGRYRMRLAGE
jgi:type II restriction enzyme